MRMFFLIVIIVSDFVQFFVVRVYLVAIEGSIKVLFGVGAYGIAVYYFVYS